MNPRAARSMLLLLWLWPSVAGAGQAIYRPSPAPDVTAAAEAWYLAGEPVTYGGHLYYPAGPTVYFMPHEMVRTGEYRGIPLYARTTFEPRSIVFVPVARGLMQPYERRRDGDLAGTVGSRTPSFPVVRSGTDPVAATGASPGTDHDRRVVFIDPLGEFEPATGTIDAARPWVDPRRPKAPGPRDGIFIVFEGERWYSAGPPVRLPASELTRIGEHHGWPIYRRGQTRVRPGSDSSDSDTAIYVPLSREPDAPLARYSRR